MENAVEITIRDLEAQLGVTRAGKVSYYRDIKYHEIRMSGLSTTCPSFFYVVLDGVKYEAVEFGLEEQLNGLWDYYIRMRS